MVTVVKYAQPKTAYEIKMDELKTIRAKYDKFALDHVSFCKAIQTKKDELDEQVKFSEKVMLDLHRQEQDKHQEIMRLLQEKVK